VRSANLDVLVELRNAAGAVLASANPVDALPASLSTSLAASGTYYVTVQGVGKGDPLGTGYTDYGSLGVYSVSVSATPAASQPPIAAASATPTSGTAPLNVVFSSAGSTDPDGSITGYEWSFGDGSALATTASTSHTYSAPGTYSAQLKVTDNSFLTATKALTITVTQLVPPTVMHVAAINMSSSGSSRNWRAIAGVVVTAAGGLPVAGATVTGTWTGLVLGSATGVTGSNGLISLSSPSTKISKGTITFTVTGVTLSGNSYDASANLETADSISR
jgi:PKD repeat protein